MTVIATEAVCEDCMAGNHMICRREGGWFFLTSAGRPSWANGNGDHRCGCHLTSHSLDPRPWPFSDRAGLTDD